MLGCYTDFDRHSKQYKWLKKDLAKVDRSRTPWLIVGMHAPWYNSNVAHQGEVESMRSSMETLLFENGVDAVFAGELSILITIIRLFFSCEHVSARCIQVESAHMQAYQ